MILTDLTCGSTKTNFQKSWPYEMQRSDIFFFLKQTGSKFCTVSNFHIASEYWVLPKIFISRIKEKIQICWNVLIRGWHLQHISIAVYSNNGPAVSVFLSDTSLTRAFSLVHRPQDIYLLSYMIYCIKACLKPRHFYFCKIEMALKVAGCSQKLRDVA